MKVAVVCNFGDQCGIATYSKYLIDHLAPKVAAIKIFAEIGEGAADLGYDVERCWKRGQSLSCLSEAILAWQPDVVLIQHEFGIFPRATYWLQLLDRLADIPYAVTVHSVYRHLDKVVCTAPIQNAIVHTKEAADCYKSLGGRMPAVIPHGCVVFDDVQENWNLFQTPYAVIQFGFGFRYKGVDMALRAISHLKSLKPDKYKDIFYTYLASENPNTRNINRSYRQELIGLVRELDLIDNVAIVPGYHEDQVINQYLRTAKLAVFPYVPDAKNVVYGASGAIRVAMANGIPVIGSTSPMFSDLEGVIPRAATPEGLAKEIGMIFSDGGHKASVLERQSKFIRSQTWDVIAGMYADHLGRIRENFS